MGEEDTEPIEIPDDQKIKHPYLLLWYHIASKGFQIGSVGGICAGIPLSLYDRYRYQLPIQSTFLKTISHSSILGIVGLSVAACYLVPTRSDEIDDVAYKVYHNETMYKWETLAWSGTTIGGIAGCVPQVRARLLSNTVTETIPLKQKMISVWRGSSLGCGVAMATYFALNFEHTFKHLKTQTVDKL